MKLRRHCRPSHNGNDRVTDRLTPEELADSVDWARGYAADLKDPGSTYNGTWGEGYNWCWYDIFESETPQQEKGESLQ